MLSDMTKSQPATGGFCTGMMTMIERWVCLTIVLLLPAPWRLLHRHDDYDWKVGLSDHCLVLPATGGFLYCKCVAQVRPDFLFVALGVAHHGFCASCSLAMPGLWPSGLFRI